MLSYQYRNSHYKDKTVWWRSYLYNGNPHTCKDCLYIEIGVKWPACWSSSDEWPMTQLTNTSHPIPVMLLTKFGWVLWFITSFHFFFQLSPVNSISVLRCPWQPAYCCIVLLTSVAMESSGVILAMVAWSVWNSSFYRPSGLLKFQEQTLDITMNIMSIMAFQITRNSTLCSTAC